MFLSLNSSTATGSIVLVCSDLLTLPLTDQSDYNLPCHTGHTLGPDPHQRSSHAWGSDPLPRATDLCLRATRRAHRFPLRPPTASAPAVAEKNDSPTLCGEDTSGAELEGVRGRCPKCLSTPGVGREEEMEQI